MNKVLEKDIQKELESNPQLLPQINLGICIKSEFIQDNNKRLDSVFEYISNFKNTQSCERYVVEYMLGKLNIDHIARGVLYAKNEESNNLDYNHTLFLISTKLPNKAECEFVNIQKQVCKIRTFIYDCKLKSYTEYLCDDILKNIEQLEIQKKIKTPIQKPKKKTEVGLNSWNLDFQENFNTFELFKYHDFFFPKESSLFKKIIKKGVFYKEEISENYTNKFNYIKTNKEEILQFGISEDDFLDFCSEKIYTHKSGFRDRLIGTKIFHKNGDIDLCFSNINNVHTFKYIEHCKD